MHKLHWVQNNAARIVVQAPKRSDAKPLLRRLHWLPVEQSITYKTAVLMFKIQNTATPAYLNRHLQSRDCVRNLRSSGTPLLVRPSWKTDFAARGFRHSAPAVWNSLSSKTVLDGSSLTLFKSRLRSHLFHMAYNDRQWCNNKVVIYWSKRGFLWSMYKKKGLGLSWAEKK